MVYCCSSDNLHYASEHGNLEIAKFVLENGVEVDVRNKFDETPMMARTYELENCYRDFVYSVKYHFKLSRGVGAGWAVLGEPKV